MGEKPRQRHDRDNLMEKHEVGQEDKCMMETQHTVLVRKCPTPNYVLSTLINKFEYPQKATNYQTTHLAMSALHNRLLHSTPNQAHPRGGGRVLPSHQRMFNFHRVRFKVILKQHLLGFHARI